MTIVVEIADRCVARSLSVIGCPRLTIAQSSSRHADSPERRHRERSRERERARDGRKRRDSEHKDKVSLVSAAKPERQDRKLMSGL